MNFRRIMRITRKHKYKALDYDGALELSSSVAYGQAIQGLDSAAQRAEKKKDVRSQIEISKIWLAIADDLGPDNEPGTPGFRIKE